MDTLYIKDTDGKFRVKSLVEAKAAKAAKAVAPKKESAK